MQNYLSEARETLHPLYTSREHWLLITDGEGCAVADKIRRKYYNDAPLSDWAAYPAIVNGVRLVVVAARKRRMLAYQLNSILRQMTTARLSDRELVGRDIVMVADPARLDACTRLIVALFDESGLAMAA